MKKLALTAALLIASASITACGDTSTVDSLISQEASSSSSTLDPALFDSVQQKRQEDPGFPDTSDGDVDVDLTKLSSSMVYGQVYDMVYSSDDYVGKKVRAKGNFSYYKDTETGKEYFAVLIKDATACCSQGIEFVLPDKDAVYPDDYPPLNAEITVEGEFDYYTENYSTYCQLLNAKVSYDEAAAQ